MKVWYQITTQIGQINSPFIKPSKNKVSYFIKALLLSTHKVKIYVVQKIKSLAKADRPMMTKRYLNLYQNVNLPVF